MSKYTDKIKQIKDDEFQWEAFLSKRNTVVQAGPGSGKTTIITLKILKLLTEEISPNRGLACITYNREAAREFTDRLNELGFIRNSKVFLGTVHSFCISEVIMPFGKLFSELQIPQKLVFVSNKTKHAMVESILTSMNQRKDTVKVDEIDKERRNNIIGLSKVKVPYYDLALKVAIQLEDELIKRQLVDFDLIVKHAITLIQSKEYVRKSLEAKFQWILIDEYQDLGKPLHEMILTLVKETKIKFFAVGDPDQSIYGFQGANPNYLHELADIFKSPIVLKNNYRSTQDIVDASKSIFEDGHAREYHSKSNTDKQTDFYFITCNHGMLPQYELVSKKIVPYCLKRGIPLEEIAVLSWSNTEIKEISKLFTQENIPFYVSKFDFERSDVVKWLEKCSAWCSGQYKLFEEIFKFWLFLKSDQPDFREKLKEKISFYKQLKESIKHTKLSDWLNFILENIGLKKQLEHSEFYPDELINLENLIKSIKNGDLPDTDFSKLSQIGKPLNQVTLSTRHSSKGLEFEAVILLGLEEGRFPYYSDKGDKLEEAYRVFFVCVSRAKSKCFLVHSKSHTINTRYGVKTFNYEPSRFWITLHGLFGNTMNTLKDSDFNK